MKTITARLDSPAEAALAELVEEYGMDQSKVVRKLILDAHRSRLDLDMLPLGRPAKRRYDPINHPPRIVLDPSGPTASEVLQELRADRI